MEEEKDELILMTFSNELLFILFEKTKVNIGSLPTSLIPDEKLISNKYLKNIFLGVNLFIITKTNYLESTKIFKIYIINNNQFNRVLK